MDLRRRDFLKLCLGTTGYLLTGGIGENLALTSDQRAEFYQSQPKEAVQCLLCPHSCVLKDKERGVCRARENRQGILYTLSYDKPCAVHIDPIEKKPFFHVLPASTALSLAAAGCNLRCKFCQNWQISQAAPEQVEPLALSIPDIINAARQKDCRSIAFTYTEPTVFYEYALDIIPPARKNKLGIIMHSNGYINPAPLRAICPFFTAINVDLKGFTEDYYRTVCRAELAPVLESLVIIRREKKVWLELTNLVIPTLNDSSESIRKMCVWIRDNLGDEVPLHFSRFYPMYQLTSLPPTPVSTLETARGIAIDAGLKFVYIGNIPGHPGEHTYCPACQKILVRRNGYSVLENSVIAGKCRYCQEPIPGVWQ